LAALTCAGEDDGQSVTILLGIAAAVLFGVGDLIAGVGGRRAKSANAPAGIAFVASLVGAVLSGIYLLFVDGGLSGPDLWWSLAAGVASAVARLLLYRGMTVGPIVVFAPVMALVAIIVPAVVGPLVGQDLVALEVVGVVIAIPAVVLVASERRLPTLAEIRGSQAFMSGLIVGSLIGTVWLFLSFVSEEAGAAPVFVMTALGVVVIPVTARLLGLSFLPGPVALRFGALVGVTSLFAMLLSVLMYQRGTAAVGSAMIGLSPGVSIVLAWKFLGERVWPIQVLGGGLGVVTVTMFALSL